MSNITHYKRNFKENLPIETLTKVLLFRGTCRIYKTYLITIASVNRFLRTFEEDFSGV